MAVEVACWPPLVTGIIHAMSMAALWHDNANPIIPEGVGQRASTATFIYLSKGASNADWRLK